MYESEIIEGLLAGSIVFLLLLLLIIIAIEIVFIIGRWKMYEKAGVAGWKAIIPFYSDYVLTVEVAKTEWYWFLCLLGPTIGSLISGIIPFASTLGIIAEFVGLYFINKSLAPKLHKDTGWIILATIFSNIMYCIIGFSKNEQFDNTVIQNNNTPNNGQGQIVGYNPQTGQPIYQAVNPVVQNTQANFDPMTGKPLNQNMEMPKPNENFNTQDQSSNTPSNENQNSN